MAKKKKPQHHPDYDPDVGCGSLYLQEEVAVQLLLAIAHALRHNKKLTALDKDRLLVGATVINDVFGFGVEKFANTKEDR
jgi:hypothetical protein